MKIFKNFKTRKQLKAEIVALQKCCEDLKKDYEIQKKILKGERVYSTYCRVCNNRLEYKNWTGTYYDCLLDCHCKDFERKESEE